MILGLTGSIGMGKSTTANIFRSLGIPVHDADRAVHRLYREKAVPLIAGPFPEAVRNGSVDRKILSSIVLGNTEKMRHLEAIVHPLVREEEKRFLSSPPVRERALVVLDIPLLFETGSEGRCDAVLVVTAPFETQLARVLSRPAMNRERFDDILCRQMPDREKRKRAHMLVATDRGFAQARKQVADIVRALAGSRSSRQESH